MEKYEFDGSWHPKEDINLNTYNLKFAGMMTGCGLGQITDLKWLALESNLKITKEEFILKFSGIKGDGCGAILCTLGQNHYLELEQIILNLGFELISEYNNYKHSSFGNYKQRLYILKL